MRKAGQPVPAVVAPAAAGGGSGRSSDAAADVEAADRTAAAGTLDAVRLVSIPAPPSWWSSAACLGDGASAWMARTGGAGVGELRRTCARCPVAGECLSDAMDLPERLRVLGPMRCGITGVRAWAAVVRLVDELAPTTAEDWRVLAAWLVDDFR